MLLCSPAYLNEASLPLCVSGEPESQPLAFSKPCTLWASPANPGSLELANDLAAAFAGLTVSTVADVGSSASARPSTALRGLARRRASDVTHMLLYLNQNTWLEEDGERLAEQVKQAREDKLKIVMAHENDPALGGCQFSRFFEVTPQERMSHSDARPEPRPPTTLSSQRRRSSSPADSTRTWQNRASRGATARRAPSLPQLDFAFRDEQGRPCPQVSLVLLAKSLGATPARSRADLLVSGSVAEGSTSLARRSFGGLSRVFAKMSSRSSAEARDVSGGEASSVQRQV